MHLGTYRFEGDPDDLLAGYDRMLAGFPTDTLLVHLCVRRPDGITIIDTCPSAADFRSFSTSPEFHAALDAAGLPTPEIDSMGEVHHVHVPSGPVAIA